MSLRCLQICQIVTQMSFVKALLPKYIVASMTGDLLLNHLYSGHFC